MSLYIPDDVKNIMYKYKHNLEMKEICKEIKFNSYTCINCNSNCMDIITPIYIKCNECHGKICIDCSAHLHFGEEKTKNCLNCIAKNCYLLEIERILNRKLECMEDDRFLTILDDHNLIDYEVLMLVNHLKDLETNEFSYAQELHNEINIFCTSEWGYDDTSSIIAIDYDLEVDDYESDDAGSNRFFF